MKLKKLTAVVLGAVMAFGVAGSFAANAETVSSSGAYIAPQLSVDLGKNIDDNGFIVDVDYNAINLVDYKNMVVPAEYCTPDEATIDGWIESQMPAVQTTEGVVANGDTVNIDYVGYIDGVAFNGGSTNGMGTEVTIGVTQYIDDFLQQLIGHNVGDIFDVEVTFPEDYGMEDVKGKDAVFSVRINYKYADITADQLTDAQVAEYFADLGVKTVKQLRQYVADELGYTMMGSYIYNEVFANSTVDPIPETAVELQGDYILASMEMQAMNYGLSLEDMLLMYGFADAEEFKLINAETIQASAKEICINQAIAYAEGFTVTDADVAEYFGGEDYSLIEQIYGKEFVKFLVLQSNTLTWLMDETARETADTTNPAMVVGALVLVVIAGCMVAYVLKNKKAAEKVKDLAADAKEEIVETVEDAKTEICEIAEEIKEELTETVEEIKEEICEIKEETENK